MRARRTPTPLESLGTRLRALREARGLTQEALAVRSGFTGKYVSEIERGLRDVPLSTLHSLVVDGLGFPMAEAFGESTDETLLQSRDPFAGREAAFGASPAVMLLVKDLAQLPEETQKQVATVVRSMLKLVRPPRGRG